MEPVLAFEIDLSSGPRLQTLHRQLRRALQLGRFCVGAKLPSTRSLAQQLDIARNTVIAAYDRLAAEGFIELKPGASATVAAAICRRSTREVDAALVPKELPQSPTHAREPVAASFGLGLPDSSLFPHALWRRLSARALRTRARESFCYPPVAGLERLRAAIAAHIAFARAVACTREQVMVTSGAQQSFYLIARWLVAQGRGRIAVEDPGYPPMCQAFRAAGAQVIPVAVDAAGLSVQALPGLIDAIAVTPSHQSPTGVVMSLHRRRQLLEYARLSGGYIIEDDYDGEFRLGAHPLDALQTLDQHGRVFYLGTFSKSLHPGIRKGYVVLPESAQAGVVDIKSALDGGIELHGQETLANFIEEGHLARHIRRMRAVYSERRAVLESELNARFSEHLQVLPGAAGLHLCAQFHSHSRPGVLRSALAALPGALNVAQWRSARSPLQAMAIGYGCTDIPGIRAGLRRLDEALRG